MDLEARIESIEATQMKLARLLRELIIALEAREIVQRSRLIESAVTRALESQSESQETTSSKKP